MHMIHMIYLQKLDTYDTKIQQAWKMLDRDTFQTCVKSLLILKSILPNIKFNIHCGPKRLQVLFHG